MIKIPENVEDTLELLSSGNYVSDRSLSTAVYLSLKLGRPLFLEGEAGVGKTEIAKVLSETLGRRLVRLQCYEGLDVASAVYEWNYSAQMIEIRMAEAEGIVAEAREEARRIEENVQARTTDTLKRREQQALDMIAAAEARAVADVRALAADIAIDATQRILTETVEGQKGDELVDEAIREVPGKLN